MFAEQLYKGKVGESQIAEWLKGRGHNILPIYEIEKNQYAGPALFVADGRKIIAPDMLVFKGEKTIWIEAKHKNAFSWHRITKRFVTGIDIHHYSQYKEVMKLSCWPVWLLFLHKPGVAKDSHPGPSGLFGNDLKVLTECENHTHENHGKSGMVYWDVESLKKLAEYPL